MSRNVRLARALWKIPMISIVVIAALAMLALLTQAGVVVLEQAYAPRGKPIEVAGAVLNVVELGRNDWLTRPL